MRGKNKLLERLVRNRFQPNKVVRQILDDERREEIRKSKPKYIKGVYNGVFYNIKVPPERPILPKIPKLEPGAGVPKPLQDPAGKTKEEYQELIDKLKAWWKLNWPALVLNFGSICSLLGFTRSDVLELRLMSVVGSITSIAYFSATPPVKFTPIAWALTFMSVNGWNIYKILDERKGSVRLTQKQEEIYTKFFMPHGVTPKQFEYILQASKTVRIPKGECVVKEGTRLKDVYLVVEGKTSAQTLGRHLTAASFSPEAHHQRRGGASGAWIGEMAFLESYWLKEQGKQHDMETTDADLEAERNHSTDKRSLFSGILGRESKTSSRRTSLSEKRTVRPVDQPAKRMSSRSMVTVVALEDSTIMKWSHEDMEALMQKSIDLRGALTRAMSAAIVGKVINFTVSRSASQPVWSRWLKDWSSGDGAPVVVDVKTNLDLGESPAGGPVKKFG